MSQFYGGLLQPGGLYYYDNLFWADESVNSPAIRHTSSQTHEAIKTQEERLRDFILDLALSNPLHRAIKGELRERLL